MLAFPGRSWRIAPESQVGTQIPYELNRQGVLGRVCGLIPPSSCHILRSLTHHLHRTTKRLHHPNLEQRSGRDLHCLLDRRIGSQPCMVFGSHADPCRVGGGTSTTWSDCAGGQFLMAGGAFGQFAQFQTDPTALSNDELASRLKGAAAQGNEDAERLLKEMEEAGASTAKNLEELRKAAEKVLGPAPIFLPVASQGSGGGGGAALMLTQSDARFYRVARRVGVGFVDGWGVGFEPKPEGLAEVKAVSASPRVSLPHSLALKVNGTVVAWGNNSKGQTNVPEGLANVVAVAAGGHHSMALKLDATVVVWGDDSQDQITGMPEGLSGVVDIKAGLWHSMALKEDGTVAVWGELFVGPDAVPEGLNEVTAIAAGARHCLALKSDHTVVAWGRDYRDDNTLNLQNFDPAFVPEDLTDVVSISAGILHNQALLADGTVRVWGKTGNGGMGVPQELDSVVLTGAGWHYGLALTVQGDFIHWGQDPGPGGMDAVVGFSAGASHVLVIRTSDASPVIRRQPRDVTVAVGTAAYLSVEATSELPLNYQWLKNGVEINGATSSTLAFSSLQNSDNGMYQVRASAGSKDILSREAKVTAVGVPTILNQSPDLNVRLVQGDGNAQARTLSVTVDGQGTDSIHYDWYHDGQIINRRVIDLRTEPFLRVQVSGVADEGEYWVVVSTIGGSATSQSWHVKITLIGESTGWGQNYFGQLSSSRQETNLVAMSAGAFHNLGLRENGTLYAWGANFAQQIDVPAGLDGVIAVAAGWSHSLALREDGTVIAWGENGQGQAAVPSGTGGIIGIAAGTSHSLALKSDGTVMAWGDNSHGEVTIPANLTGVKQVAAGAGLSFALLQDGTVRSWGDGGTSPIVIPQGLNGVVQIAAGYSHALALKSDGTVVGLGVDSGAMETVPPSGLDNVMGIAAGWNFSLALINDGTIRAWGDNDLGLTDVPEALGDVKMVAAGANHGLALTYSPTLNYPVNVSQDLLVIYNADSPDSTTLKTYYLANRPMVSDANVVGINCRRGELFLTESERTDELVEPILDWLDANPTIRPAYYILMYDIPSRIPDDPNKNVMVHLRDSIPGTKPYISHFNMGTLQDCLKYVDKLAAFGNTFSPGKVVISPRNGGYSDLTYQLDNVGGQVSWPEIIRARDTLLDLVVPEDYVIYQACICELDGTQPNILMATNVAAYVSRGYHGGLGTNWAIDGRVKFFEESEWFIVQTIESWNGMWIPKDGQGSFQRWFEHNSFGGVNYSHTAVGAISHTTEPFSGVNETSTYLRLWEQGKYFVIAAWNSKPAPPFQATGDPLITR